MGFFNSVQETISTGGLNVVDDLTGGNVRDTVMSGVDAITGQTAADAAQDAAALQAQAAMAQADATREATEMTVEEQRLAREQARSDLQPFVQFGQGFMGTARDAITSSQDLFNDPMAIMQNPMFAAIMQDNQRQILQNTAARGRVGTGGTAEALQNAALRTGFDILNTERNAMLQNARFMSDVVGMGQSAAAGQGSASMQAGGNIANAITQGNITAGDLTTSAADAEAAGIVGGANAQQQGIMNVLNLGATLFGAA